MLAFLFALAFLAVLRRCRRRVVLAPLFLLFLWTWPPTVWLFSGSLEWRYPVRPLPAADGQAIVVLGGSTYRANLQAEGLPGNGTYSRCRYAAWLYKNWKPLPIVVSGGPDDPLTAPAEVMRHILLTEGVPESKILVERASGSTFENALFTSRLLAPQGIRSIVLVTEAHHMLRSERAFLKQGFAVVPAPSSFRTLSLDKFLWPSAKAAQYNDEALHEWLGLLVYTATGKL